ncbi:MAG: APC family permease [Vulcanimicrobiaceae bacterium]
MATLLRRLGTRDAALIVMGGIVGSGIFRSPSAVAKIVHAPGLVLLAWIVGGLIALLGATLFAELAARRPENGGLYAYLRDAFHPAVAFAYGWTLLLVSQSGGAAASAVTFAAYIGPLIGIHAPVWILAVLALAFFTFINSLGVRTGTTTQNAFMVAKIVAICALVVVGLFAPQADAAASAANTVFAAVGPSLFLFALVPVLFAYNGWQTASFMTGELRRPERTLPAGIIFGVLGVIVLYLAVNVICVRVLGPVGLAQTTTPASDVARVVLGGFGARAMALVVALSTLGFMSNQILTAPRVYFQMACDGIFFGQLARLHPRTRVPVIAILVQGVAAMLLALTGSFDRILNYVTSIDYVFFALAVVALFIFRARDRRAGSPTIPFRVPGHPWTTALFGLISVAVVATIVLHDPTDAVIGFGILLVSLPVYALFARRRVSV